MCHVKKRINLSTFLCKKRLEFLRSPEMSDTVVSEVFRIKVFVQHYHAAVKRGTLGSALLSCKDSSTAKKFDWHEL